MSRESTMAFGSGNNNATTNKSTHHHVHQSSTSSITSHPPQQPQPPQQQLQKCSTTMSPSNSSVPLPAPPKGYYDASCSSNDTFQQQSYQGHMFFPGSNSFKGGKQCFQRGFGYGGSGRGDEGEGYFGGERVSGGNLQQYNQQFHHSGGVVGQGQLGNTRDLNSQERALLDQIRSRKAELLQEIAQLQDEIDSVSRELLYSQKEEPPPPDLISTQNPHHHGHQRSTSSIHNHADVPLADVELDNLSEHSEHEHGGGGQKIPSSTVLGSNSSTTSSNSSKEKDRMKIMSLGCKKFNMDPKKGIEFLVENGLLKKDDEQDIAVFLYRGEGLNKTAIGDFLGEKSGIHERVLKAFVGLHDFTDLILVQALRQFLWSFRLPGEAQKIDRMMECFAQRYCQNNPDIFTNTDTCYVLSFAIIMLNTSLHNPSVKDKPTIETFVKMNRGINNGGDLPRELLISLFNSIQSEPFKIPEDDGNDLMHTFFNPDKEGWLWKQGGRYKTWKRRWFILNDNCLYYFEFTTDKEPRGIIPLENVNVREIEDGGGSKSRQRYCFELYATDGSEVIKACKTDSDGRVVEGKHSVYRMSAASGEERDSWVKALRQSISYSPFYEILRKSGGGAAGGSSSSNLRSGGRLRE